MAILRGAPDDMPIGEYNQVSKISGSIQSVYSGAQAFTKPVKEIKIRVAAHGAKIKLSPDGINWTDEIYIPDRSTVVMTFDCHSIDIVSAVTSGHCLYIIEGFYQE